MKEDDNMSKEDIIQEAKDDYQKVFKDQEKRNSQDEENEVIFNQTELKKEIQDHVKRQTAPYKYPRIVEFVPELPKTISGKIRRVEIRENN